jgi:hypothetical protein
MKIQIINTEDIRVQGFILGLKALIILTQLIQLISIGLLVLNCVSELRSQLLLSVAAALKVSLQPLDIRLQPETKSQ